MRLLYLRNLYWPEDFGGNRYAYELTSRLARRGHEVRVLTGRTETALRREAPAGIRISTYPALRGNPLVTHATNAFASAPAIARALAEPTDVAMVASYDVALALFARRSRPPSAFVYHSSLYSEAIERLRSRGPLGRLAYGTIRTYMDAVERRVLGSAEAIVAVSDFSRDEIAARAPSAAARTRLIHTGVDTQFFAPTSSRGSARERFGIPAGDRVAVVVGRLVAVKRYERALETVAALSTRGLPTTLLVVGEGPERARLEARADRLGIRDRVRFLGFLTGEAHRDALRASDIQLCTSDFENLSLSLLEGLATGVPVVSVPTGGTVRLLRAIDPRLLSNDVGPAALADAATAILRETGVQAELATRSRAYVVAEHDWEIVVTRIESLLRELAPRAR